MLRKHEWQRENEFGSALWMIQHRIESDRLRLVAFLLPRHGFEPELLYIYERLSAKTSLLPTGNQNLMPLE